LIIEHKGMSHLKITIFGEIAYREM
jgi:hypothetical protein